MNLAAGLDAVISSPLFGITLTVAAYWVAMRLNALAGGHPLVNPMFFAMMLAGAVVLVFDIEVADYQRGAQYLSFLLGPATVALGLPVYRHRTTIARSAPMIATALLTGCVAAIASGYLITRALGGSPDMALSMAPKSATTPISIALAEQIGGIPALAAVFTILAGVLGVVFAGPLMSLARIRSKQARGLAIGLASHGVGTAKALEDDETVGAFSGLAMGLNGMATSVLLVAVLGLIQ